jgi:hypothetical protein
LPGAELVLWLALLVGFLPVLAEYLRGFAARYSPASTLLAPVLIALCFWHGKAGEQEPRRIGAMWIAAGLLLELTGLAARTFTVAWLGFPVAVLGMALWLGSPSWRVAVLAFGLVPPPVSLQLTFSPTLETALLSAACAVWRSVGLAVSCSGPEAQLGAHRLGLGAEHVGWILVPVFVQLGWFVAICAESSTGRALRTALAFGVAALVVQPLAIVIALGLLAVSTPVVAGGWLSHGVWLLGAACVLVGSMRSRASRARSSDAAPA